MRRRIRMLMLPDPDEVEGADPAAARIDGALRRALSRSRRPRAAPAPRGVPARARRCGSSASAPPICCRSRRASDRSRSSSRPIASACATSSICRRSSTCCGASAAGRCASRRSSRGRRRRLRPSLLFNYVANYIYDGDAPLAERRAQALAVDQSQLRELIGEAELRDLLDDERDRGGRSRPAAPARALSREVRRRRARSAAASRRSDARRDRARAPSPDAAEAAPWTPARQRAAPSSCSIAGEPRLVAVEDAARYRDALGTPLPQGLPAALLDARRRCRSAILLKRYARTHGPFTAGDLGARASACRLPSSMRRWRA